MKKKTLIVSLLLTMALVFGSVATSFAATGLPTDASREAMKKTGFQCVQKIHDEKDAEKIANTFADEVLDGGYKVIDTDGVKNLLNKSGVVIVDTMPAGWYAQRHVVGAVNAEAGHDGTVRFSDFDNAQKAELLKQVKAKAGTKKVTYYWNGKKWVTKKPKTLKKCTKKKDKHYNKKKYTVKDVNKDAKIVVYCGFVGCARSHEAAKFLVKKGFKNVYRYSGGIAAWIDGNCPVEGSDI